MLRGSGVTLNLKHSGSACAPAPFTLPQPPPLPARFARGFASRLPLVSCRFLNAGSTFARRPAPPPFWVLRVLRFYGCSAFGVRLFTRCRNAVVRFGFPPAGSCTGCLRVSGRWARSNFGLRLRFFLCVRTGPLFQVCTGFTQGSGFPTLVPLPSSAGSSLRVRRGSTRLRSFLLVVAGLRWFWVGSTVILRFGTMPQLLPVLRSSVPLVAVRVWFVLVRCRFPRHPFTTAGLFRLRVPRRLSYCAFHFPRLDFGFCGRLLPAHHRICCSCVAAVGSPPCGSVAFPLRVPLPTPTVRPWYYAARRTHAHCAAHFTAHAAAHFPGARIYRPLRRVARTTPRLAAPVRVPRLRVARLLSWVAGFRYAAGRFVCSRRLSRAV